MPKKISIIILSLIVAFGFMSGGYGYWQKKLVIDGSGIVVKQVEKELPTLTKTFTGSDNGQIFIQTNEEDIIGEEGLSNINSQNTGNGVEGSYEGNGENLGDSGNNSDQGIDINDEGSSIENGNNESGNNESNYSESGSSQSGNSVSDSSGSSSDSGSSVSGSSDSGTSDSGSDDSGSSDSGSSDSGSGDSTVE